MHLPLGASMASLLKYMPFLDALWFICREKNITKKYLALVTGAMEKGAHLSVDAPIDRHPDVKSAPCHQMIAIVLLLS